jgi:hypothetical protein
VTAIEILTEKFKLLIAMEGSYLDQAGFKHQIRDAGERER